MGSYRLEIKPAALKNLQALPKQIAVRLVNAIDQLVSNPRPVGCKKLRGEKDRYRIRLGDYRVLYRIDDQEIVVTVVRVAHRKEAYS